MALYTKTVMEHFINPRNTGTIENPDGVGEVGNDSCGDVVKIYLKIKKDMVEDVKFETYGCTIAIASSSIATELIKGKTVCNALTLEENDIIKSLGGIPEEKINCSLLVVKAIKLAIDDYYTKEPEKYVDDELTCNHTCNHTCNCHHCCRNKGC